MNLVRYCTLMVWRCSIPSQDKTPCASLAACSLSRWSSCCAYAFPGFRCSHRTKKVSQVIPWFHKKCDIIDLVFRKGCRVHHMNKSILVFWGWYFRCTYQLSPSLGVAVSQKKHLRHDHHLGIRSHPHIHWQSSVKQNPYDIPIYWLV